MRCPRHHVRNSSVAGGASPGSKLKAAADRELGDSDDEDDDLDDDAEDQFPDFNLRLDNVESSGYGRNISLTRLSSDDLDAQRLAELKARLEQVKKPLEKTQIREEIRELKKKMHADGKKV